MFQNLKTMMTFITSGKRCIFSKKAKLVEPRAKVKGRKVFGWRLLKNCEYVDVRHWKDNWLVDRNNLSEVDHTAGATIFLENYQYRRAGTRIRRFNVSIASIFRTSSAIISLRSGGTV